MWLGANARGSTHDSTAWSTTKLSMLIPGAMAAGFWIAGDEAYGASDFMLTPYSGKKLDTRRDSFNFHQSATRITIERSFGILVGRWGILHCALTCNLDNAVKVVQACMLLHNICIHDSAAEAAFANHTRRTHLYHDSECDIAHGWPFPVYTTSETADVLAGRRRDLEVSSLRDALADQLAERGIVRPPRSNYRS